jgi:hypothetical protein
LLLFLYVTEEAGRKYVRDMPWPLAAECNMITNKQTLSNSNCIAISRMIGYVLAPLVSNSHRQEAGPLGK